MSETVPGHADLVYPGPTPEMLTSPQFEAVWQAIKGWDISRHNDGLYAGPTGNDVRHILDALSALATPIAAHAGAVTEAGTSSTPYRHVWPEHLTALRPDEAAGQGEADDRVWLIRKRGYFYRPNFAGYACCKAEAGRYTKAEADAEVANEPASVKAIHQDDVLARATPRPEASDASDIVEEPAVIAALRALRAADALSCLAGEGWRPKVKPLDWAHNGKTGADTPFGMYEVGTRHREPSIFVLLLGGGEVSEHNSPKEAKAAAQADFDHRILSALDLPAPSAEEKLP